MLFVSHCDMCSKGRDNPTSMPPESPPDSTSPLEVPHLHGPVVTAARNRAPILREAKLGHLSCVAANLDGRSDALEAKHHHIIGSSSADDRPCSQSWASWLFCGSVHAFHNWCFPCCCIASVGSLCHCCFCVGVEWDGMAWHGISNVVLDCTERQWI